MISSGEMKIKELWADKSCPIVNGIIYGNGVIERFELIRNKSGESEELTLKPKNQTTVVDFLNNEPDDVTSLSPLSEKLVVERGFKLIAGEGGWGGDGFIAVENLQTEELIFLIFFDNSNPFVEINFLDSNILATSNLGEKWIVPVEEPGKMIISST